MIRACLLAALMPLPALAVTLDLPSNATLTAEVTEGETRYDMPTGSWTPEGLPTAPATGAFNQQAWRIEAAGLTTFQILDPLMAQLTEAGFEIAFECTDDVCGGFDFRFATPVLPAPEMEVNFGDYRFVSARRDGEAGPEVVTLLASRTSQAGFVQIIRVGGAAEAATQTVAPAIRAAAPTVTGDLAAGLEEDGRFILSDLTFATGSAQLGGGTFASLTDLADYLAANPSRVVALVGHTDAVGSLDGNIALSKRRAGSVLERLVSTYNVPRRQLDAQGMGYLAPVATNVTAEGREANRRVEVIITSTE
ncbi:OmpA family protein [Pseudooctadecabacter jejudonensis]|uniref:Outer membrane porin F n=1 Tax=Pseudooctadecabacter jejudonensis TaxID=1391910 RepID=A0A1Y5S0K1_9RHOB|nr:OmpA family protein [Pseudooctadecabacter jejudonensis]SLN29952.1 Outer membrane porin F precursor [Pseudooctadecabacter jejudonensis]